MLTIKGHPNFVILCRVSTRGQVDGASLDVQEQKGRAYVKRVGGHVIKVYRGDESGLKSIENRDMLRQMLADAETGKFDSLYTLDRSRLGRNPETMMGLWAIFKARGVTWHTESGPTDIDTPEGRLLSGVMAFVEEYGATKPRSRTGQSRQKMLELGQHAFGRWPYGRQWNKQTKKWEIELAKKRLMERAYKLYVQEGKSLEQVAKSIGMAKSSLTKRLHSAGLKSWPRKHDGKDYLLEIPPLLHAYQATAIKRRSEMNRTVLPNASGNRWLLQGLIKCWHCHRSLTGMPSPKGNGSVYRVYRHPPAPENRTENCLWQVPADLIEQDIVGACANIIESNKALTEAIKNRLTNGMKAKKTAHASLPQIEKSIQQTNRQLDRVLDEVLASEPGTVREKLRLKAKRIESTLDSQKQKHIEAKAQLDAPEIPPDKATEIAARLRALCGLRGAGPQRSMTRDQQRLLVSIVVGRTHRDSQEGIYVRMNRFGKKQDVYWPWKLDGSLALAQGNATNFINFDVGVDIESIRVPDNATAMRLAQLALEARPITYKQSLLCSSDG